MILAKVSSVRKCLQRVQDVTQGKEELLDDINVQDIVILNVQRAIEQISDLAAHIIARNGWEMPSTVKEMFTVLADKQVISSDLAVLLRNMIGFRNIAIHEYTKLDPRIVRNVFKHHLIDLEKFAATCARLIDKMG
jgi:uncharacterized protein YutE (UPF0331/DUF86 family)